MITGPISPANPGLSSSPSYGNLFSLTGSFLQTASHRVNVVRENVANWLRLSPPVVPDLEVGRVKVLYRSYCCSSEECLQCVHNNGNCFACVGAILCCLATGVWSLCHPQETALIQQSHPFYWGPK